MRGVRAAEVWGVAVGTLVGSAACHGSVEGAEKTSVWSFPRSPFATSSARTTSSMPDGPHA